MRDHPPITATPSSNRLAAHIFDRLCEDPQTGPLFEVLRDRSPSLYQAARVVASETIAARDEGRAVMRGLSDEPPGLQVRRVGRTPDVEAKAQRVHLATRIARLRRLAERCVRVRAPGPADELVEALDELELELRAAQKNA